MINKRVLSSRLASAQNHALRKEFGWAGTQKTHCPSGHPYSKENTKYIVTQRGGWARVCIACSKEKSKRNWLKRKARLSS